MGTVKTATGRKAGPVKDEKRTKYRIAPGHTITTREEISGEMQDVVYEAGEEIEISESELAKSPNAFLKSERRRSRDGQMSRLRQQVEQLQRENKDLKARKNAKNDPEFENATESLKARGDNYIGRGEPNPFGVPSSVLDEADRAIAMREAGLDDDVDDAADFEELSGGMKGLGTEKASGPVSTGPTQHPPSPSVPSEGGESVPPGATEPTGKKSSGSDKK